MTSSGRLIGAAFGILLTGYGNLSAFNVAVSMAETQVKAVTLKNDTAGEGPAEFYFEVFDKQDRMKRAIKILLLCWFGALLSLPIIFAHWVLVPGFFLAGPYMAYRYYNTTEVPKKIAGVCPSCGGDMELMVESTDKLPMWRYCSVCNASLHIEETSTAR